MENKVSKKVMNVLNILGIVLTVWFLWYAFRNGLLTDADAMEAFLRKGGKLAPLIFIFIQIVQVVIPIIPGAVTIPIGAIVFGTWVGFCYNYIGILIGSFINFYLARRYGRPFVRAVTSEKTFDKYIGYLDHKNFDNVFLALMIWPVSPADFLCYLAGLSKISWKKYAIIITLTKPWTIFAYTYGTVELLKMVQRFFVGG